MREFTKTVTDSDGQEVTLTRSTDQAGEARTLLTTGWEETAQAQDSKPTASEGAAAPAKPERKPAKTAKTEN